MPFDKKLPRREFLRISSVVVAGTAAAGLIDGSPLLAAIRAASPLLPLLSVGYVDSVPEDGSPARLRYAADLASGDPGFIRSSARIAISSYVRNANFRGQDGGFEVDAIFPVLNYEPERYPRFRSWMAVENGGVESTSPGARFTIPVTSTGGAQFVVKRLRIGSQPSTSDEALLPLSIGVESGTIKLQRGVYVVAFRESLGEAEPNWYGLTIRSTNGALSIPDAGFSYVIITVDYAQ